MAQLEHTEALSARDMLLQRIVAKTLKSQIKQRAQDKRLPRAVFANEFIGMETYIHGTYEKNHLELFSLLIDRLSGARGTINIIDIGANVGVHARFLALPARVIHAFEPNPEVLPLLEFNVADRAGVTIHPLALSSHPGTLRLSAARDWNKGTASLEADSATEGTDVVVTTLDLMLDQVSPVGAIKIDVEGHEVEVLKGATETIERFRPVVAIEQRNDEFADGQAETPAIRLLHSMNYEMFSPEFSRDGPIRMWNRALNMIDLVASQRRRWRLVHLPTVPEGLYPMLFAVPRECVADLGLTMSHKSE